MPEGDRPEASRMLEWWSPPRKPRVELTRLGTTRPIQKWRRNWSTCLAVRVGQSSDCEAGLAREVQN